MELRVLQVVVSPDVGGTKRASVGAHRTLLTNHDIRSTCSRRRSLPVLPLIGSTRVTALQHIHVMFARC